MQANYSLLEISAVQEMANVGLGNAMSALAQMTGRTYDMEVPNVDTMTLDRLPDLIGGLEIPAVCVHMAIDGHVNGNTAFLFPWEDADTVVKTLGLVGAGSPSEPDEIAISALTEIGNIVGSSFLNAISTMSGLDLHATPPSLAIDIAASLVNATAAEAAYDDLVALAVETKFFDEDGDFSGFFVLLPTSDSLTRLFRAIGLPEAA